MNDALNALDVSTLDVVAKVSTRSTGRFSRARWTELAIYFRPGERRPFVAETIGGTNVVGERTRTRRRVYAELEGCFDFFEPGTLTERARAAAVDWFRRNRHKLDDRTRDAATESLGSALGFTGHTLAAALEWLYPDGMGQLEWEAAERLAEFERVWAVPAGTVRQALNKEADGLLLPAWCVAFITGLRFFDRVAFHKVGGTHGAR